LIVICERSAENNFIGETMASDAQYAVYAVAETLNFERLECSGNQVRHFHRHKRKPAIKVII
jgi:hypothetical protein